MRALAVWIAALFLAGCAAPTPDLKPAKGVPLASAVANVPLIEQEDFFCGPAALAMVAQWAGQDVSQDQVAELSFSPNAEGTFQSDMISAARRLGLLAVPTSGFSALTAEVSAGSPVIVFQNLQAAWFPAWHYAVVTGYDLERGFVTLHSGQLSRTTMSLARFERTWAGGDGWALIVLPPDRLPVAANEREVLNAAAGLERAKNYNAAAAAYSAGSTRWPENWLWQFGLGNALYASGDTKGAMDAWQRAAVLNPDAPEPRQNLATLRTELASKN